MTQRAMPLSYGTVPSRRLGKSLGINNIPAKLCSYCCIYCQVGRTTKLQIERQFVYDPDAIFEDVQRRLTAAAAAFEAVDYLTFVPDGEPTLDVNLGLTIEKLKSLKTPVGVITNSSLLWREDVRRDLIDADWVSLKIDAVQEPIWKRINRPHGDLRLPLILDGILDFAKSFKGKLVTETMLIRGINDHDSAVTAVAEFLHRVQPSTAYLSIPTRPPAETSAGIPDELAITRAHQLLSEHVEHVEYLIGYEGNAFVSTGDIEADLLSITAVHPMRRDAVMELLTRSGASWSVVDRLLAQKDLVEINYEGHVFYLRRFKRDPGRVVPESSGISQQPRGELSKDV